MQQQIIDEIAKHLGVSSQDIDLQSSLADDLGLSPVEVSDLLSALEDAFEVNIDPADVENLRTVNDIVVMVEDLNLE
jgi:acyl carrier protein